MSVKVKYKGEEILSLNTDGEEALATQGQYCEADIIIENTQDGDVGGDYDIEVVDDGNGGQILNITDAEGGGGGVETSEVLVTSFTAYDTFSDFITEYSAYIPSQGNAVTRISFLNNTDNARAGISGYVINDNLVLSRPQYAVVNRVGMLWQTSAYGVDVYSGSTIRFEVVRLA